MKAKPMAKKPLPKEIIIKSPKHIKEEMKENMKTGKMKPGYKGKC